MSKTSLRVDEHVARAERHRVIGDLLAEAGDEWAAVPLFYSAYHRVKAALLRDPIWNDLQALLALNGDLSPEDRFTDKHKGRRRVGGGAREWGLNDLVFVLYRPIVRQYERLHQASIAVRYSTGLDAGALEPLLADLAHIEKLDGEGGLVAPINWPRQP